MTSTQPTSVEEDTAILAHLRSTESILEGLSANTQLRAEPDIDRKPPCGPSARAVSEVDRGKRSHMILAVEFRLQRKLLLTQVQQSLEGQLQLIAACQSSQIIS